MAADTDILRDLLRRTLNNPADGVRGVIDLALDRRDLWLALLLTTVLSVLLASFTQGPGLVLPLGGDPVIVGPLTYAVILGSGLVILVFALYFMGRVLGGTGSFPATLATIVWLEVLGLIARTAQAVASWISGSAESIVAILGTIYLLWCLIRFTNELHGFDSMGKSILTLVLVFIGITFGVLPILTLIGVGASQGLPDV
mgnify:CR=1 FL=1